MSHTYLLGYISLHDWFTLPERSNGKTTEKETTEGDTEEGQRLPIRYLPGCEVPHKQQRMPWKSYEASPPWKKKKEDTMG